MINQTGDVTYLQLRGVNFGSGCLAYESLPAISGTNYLFPDSADVSYIAGKGANFCRIIFCWEALQPTLGGSISNTYTTDLINTVNLALAAGMYVMIEMHPFNSSYGVSYTYNNVNIGTSPVTNAQFANLFTKLAQQFTDPRVIFGLSNEPSGVSTATWLAASQAAINAIRATGNNNMIFVQPLNYGSAAGFFTTNYFDGSTAPSVAMLELTDPVNNLVLSVHQYFDSSDGYSGGATDIAGTNLPSIFFEPIVTWCQQNSWRFHISEFAVDSTNSIAAQTIENLYALIQCNSNVCMGGSWWSYTAVGWGPALFDLQPTTAYIVDDADMALFTPFVDGYFSSNATNYVVNKISGGVDGYVPVDAPLSIGILPALTGTVRLPNKGTVTSRNATNTADVTLLSLDGSNNLTIGNGMTTVATTTQNSTDTIEPAQGTPSTQNKNLYTYVGYCTTTNGSTSVTTLTIPVPSGKSVSANIQYIGRNTSTDGNYSGTFLTGAENKSGTAALFTGAASRTVSTIYDTALAAAGVSGTGCTSTVSGANLLVQIAGCSGMTIDWTFVAQVIVS